MLTSLQLHCKSTEQWVLPTWTSLLSYRCNHSDMETRRRLRRMRGSGGGGSGGDDDGCTPNTFSPAARQCVVSAAAVTSSPSAFMCTRPRERLRLVYPCMSVYNVLCFRYRYRGHHHYGRFSVRWFAWSSRSQSGRAPVTAWYPPRATPVSARRHKTTNIRHKTIAAEGGGKRRSRRTATTLMPPSLSVVAAPRGKWKTRCVHHVLII